MSAPKIVGMTKSCGDCPNRQATRCLLVDGEILDRDIVAPFCPLPDYPARRIADQQATIMHMRDPHKWGVNLAVITHIAAKLGRNVNANRVTTVTIPYRRGKDEFELLLLDFEYITGVDVFGGFGIMFRYGEDIFKLNADSTPPALSLQSKENPELWEQCVIIM